MVAETARPDAASDTRERILEAALEAFSQRGFDGSKTREIAVRADVTLGLLQYYFGSKTELWKASVDLAFERLRSELEAVLADPGTGDVRERLRLLLHSHVRFVARNPEFVRLMHDEGKRRGPRMRWLVDRHVKPAFDEPAGSAASAAPSSSGLLPAGVHPIHFDVRAGRGGRRHFPPGRGVPASCRHSTPPTRPPSRPTCAAVEAPVPAATPERGEVSRNEDSQPSRTTAPRSIGAASKSTQVDGDEIVDLAAAAAGPAAPRWSPFLEAGPEVALDRPPTRRWFGRPSSCRWRMSGSRRRSRGRRSSWPWA